jgi:hypothetical protein
LAHKSYPCELPTLEFVCLFGDVSITAAHYPHLDGLPPAFGAAFYSHLGDLSGAIAAAGFTGLTSASAFCVRVRVCVRVRSSRFSFVSGQPRNLESRTRSARSGRRRVPSASFSSGALSGTPTNVTLSVAHSDDNMNAKAPIVAANSTICTTIRAETTQPLRIAFVRGVGPAEQRRAIETNTGLGVLRGASVLPLAPIHPSPSLMPSGILMYRIEGASSCT